MNHLMKCAKTGTEYINNIPVGKVFGLTGVNGYQYKIVASNHNHVDDVWYEGRFLGDDYCVCYRRSDVGYWHQIGHWYKTFAGAQKHMYRKASEYSQGILEAVLR